MVMMRKTPSLKEQPRKRTKLASMAPRRRMLMVRRKRRKKTAKPRLRLRKGPSLWMERPKAMMPRRNPTQLCERPMVRRANKRR